MSTYRLRPYQEEINRIQAQILVGQEAMGASAISIPDGVIFDEMPEIAGIDYAHVEMRIMGRFPQQTNIFVSTEITDFARELNVNIEQLSTMTPNQIMDICQQRNMSRLYAQYSNSAIASIVRHYRSENYSDWRVDLRAAEHIGRRYTFQQVAAYEATFQRTEIFTDSLQAAEEVLNGSMLLDALSSEPVTPIEVPEEIPHTDPRFEELCIELVMRYRGYPREDSMAKVRSHIDRRFNIAQVERYEAFWRHENSAHGAVMFARGNEPIPADWLMDKPVYVETKKVPWKDSFLRMMYPQGVPKLLLSKVAKLTEKEAILKAIFMYNNPRTPRKVKELKANPKFLEKIREHNSQDHAAVYLSRLEDFYRMAKSRVSSRDDLLRAVSAASSINQMVSIDEQFLTHPLFKVTKCEGTHALTLTVTTRNDVWFTHMNQRMNFGKLSFLVNLQDQKIVSIKRDENFSNACPYISQNQNVCMGSNAQSIMQKLKEGLLSEALTELFVTMTNYNPDSTPYAGLDYFFEQARLGTLKRNNGETPEIEEITT